MQLSRFSVLPGRCKQAVLGGLLVENWSLPVRGNQCFPSYIKNCWRPILHLGLAQYCCTSTQVQENPLGCWKCRKTAVDIQGQFYKLSLLKLIWQFIVIFCLKTRPLIAEIRWQQARIERDIFPLGKCVIVKAVQLKNITVAPVWYSGQQTTCALAVVALTQGSKFSLFCK